MITVWKQKIRIDDNLTLRLPLRAEILTVQIQHAEPCIWYLCDPDEENSAERRFIWLGTGHERDFDAPNVSHIGTVQLEGGSLIFHLFELIG